MSAIAGVIDLDYKPHLGKKLDYGIGICGAGFIVRACHIPAYKKAGFNVVGICSRTKAKAERLAQEFNIPKVYNSFEEMCSDSKVEVVDLAYPPHEQLELVRVATKYKKHILCQKPFATSYSEAKEMVKLADEAGVKLAVNQNMRYDPAMRSVKTLINKGYLGKFMIAVFHLFSPGHWQTFLKDYDRLVILNLSVHHLDIFRFLFGEPESLYALAGGYGLAELHAAAYEAYDAEKLKGLRFKGEIIASYTLKYKDDAIAIGIDDGFSWTDDKHMHWRIEGTEGIVKGTIGWPRATNDTLSFYSKKLGDSWISPTMQDWSWFPDAFIGTMGQLLRAIEEDREPEISGKDNLKTMALIEACYKSIKERRAVAPEEIIG
ncbi:MAG: Gfo/Idh/MocA family oxidoreductase [Nitrososphaerales archaeon]